jgi:hypothetical protein
MPSGGRDLGNRGGKELHRIDFLPEGGDRTGTLKDSPTILHPRMEDTVPGASLYPEVGLFGPASRTHPFLPWNPDVQEPEKGSTWREGDRRSTD